MYFRPLLYISSTSCCNIIVVPHRLSKRLLTTVLASALDASDSYMVENLRQRLVRCVPSARHQQSSTINHQQSSTINDHQSSTINSQSSTINSQSTINHQQSDISRTWSGKTTQGRTYKEGNLVVSRNVSLMGVNLDGRS